MSRIDEGHEFVEQLTQAVMDYLREHGREPDHVLLGSYVWDTLAGMGIKSRLLHPPEKDTVLGKIAYRVSNSPRLIKVF